MTAIEGVASRERMRRIESDVPMTLWLVDLSVVPAVNEAGWLQPVELHRAARFADDTHRARYIAAHLALRLVIEREYRIAPERQRYAQDRFGRWRLLDAGGCQFSLSYAGDRAMIAVDLGAAIGVDIEPRRRIADANELAQLHFTADERADHSRCTVADRDEVFLGGWTRKEAALKALGIGLRRAPATIHTGLGGHCCVWTASHRLEIASFEVDGLVGAGARLV